MTEDLLFTLGILMNYDYDKFDLCINEYYFLVNLSICFLFIDFNKFKICY